MNDCVYVFINPFTPKSDRCQISPAASPEILHHTVWRTWLFIAYQVDKWLYYQFSLHHSYVVFSLKGGRMYLYFHYHSNSRKARRCIPADTQKKVARKPWRELSCSSHLRKVIAIDKQPNQSPKDSDVEAIVIDDDWPWHSSQSTRSCLTHV